MRTTLYTPPQPPSAAQQIGQLLALGYPLDWQAAALNVPPDVLRHALDHPTTHLEPALRSLAALLGDRVADTYTTGLNADRIAAAQAEATSRGYAPPAAYEEDGSLADPDYPAAWCELEDRATRRLRLAYYMAQGIAGEEAVAHARATTYDLKTIRHGLVWLPNGDGLDLEACWPRVRAIRAAMWDVEVGVLGPVAAAVELDLGLSRITKAQRLHPDLAGWPAATTTPETQVA